MDRINLLVALQNFLIFQRFLLSLGLYYLWILIHSIKFIKRLISPRRPRQVPTGAMGLLYSQLDQLHLTVLLLLLVRLLLLLPLMR